MTRQTPAQRHFARIVAGKSAAANEHGSVMTGDAYNLMQIQLAEHRRQLKDIQSIERKIEAKALILPTYEEWILGALNDGKGAQDDVLVSVLVWHIDVGNFGIGLQIAEYALRHGLKLADQYNRNVATMLMDELADAYERKKFDDPLQAIASLCFVGNLTEDKDAPDQARAKLHKALGCAAMEIVDVACPDGGNEIPADQIFNAQVARNNFGRALELYKDVGVKKHIEQLDRRLKKATPA